MYSSKRTLRFHAKYLSSGRKRRERAAPAPAPAPHQIQESQIRRPTIHCVYCAILACAYFADLLSVFCCLCLLALSRAARGRNARHRAHQVPATNPHSDLKFKNSVFLVLCFLLPHLLVTLLVSNLRGILFSVCTESMATFALVAFTN